MIQESPLRAQGIVIIRNVWLKLKASSYWKDIAWLASGTVLAQVVTFATMPLFTRLFSPADFAVQNLFSQIATFVAVAATYRLEYFVQLPKDEDDSLYLVQLVCLMGLGASLLLTPLLWLFRQPVAAFCGSAGLAPTMALIPVTAACMSVAVAFQGLAQRQRAFRRSGEAEVAGKAAYALTILAGWLLLPGAFGLVLGWLGASLGKMFWLYRENRWPRFGAGADFRRVFGNYFNLGGSLMVSHVLLSCTTAIPAIFIAKYYGDQTLGQYALAYQAVCLPSSLLGGAIGNVYYQRASECWARGMSFDDVWRTTAKKLVLIGLPVYAVAIAVLPWIFPLVFGQSWVPAGRYAAILGFSAFFSFATSPLDKACLVVGAWWYVPLWHAARTVTTIMVVAATALLKLDMTAFLVLFSLQQTALYLVDYWSEWKFSKLTSPHYREEGAQLDAHTA
ncbi:oligosaccharide flippase family protein [Geomonas paludis]|uniref:Polysaccharide biosynthesis protein n=1 Tax=Geomonas paludis TaxID=2740185 RepID=A0A6V8MVS5_9BACT|nr:oligosaccharide flippase family protein [Geomonas paludis]GFO63837.1 hypothetical protein GMPD_17560 [Geomonas paludis]